MSSGPHGFARPEFRQFEPGAIAHLEAKRAAAETVASRVRSGQVIGAGSGTTAYLTLCRIAERVHAGEVTGVAFVPTSFEVEMTCAQLQLASTPTFATAPDWAFDGADEVDPAGNLIKGRGGALLREKIVFASTDVRVVLVDASKMVSELNRRAPIPVEVATAAVSHVDAALAALGAVSRTIRLAGPSKDGPVLTESGNLIVDCFFEEITPTLETDIKSVTGVIESGLFMGFHPELVSG